MNDVQQAPRQPSHVHDCCGVCHAYYGDAEQHMAWHRGENETLTAAEVAIVENWPKETRYEVIKTLRRALTTLRERESEVTALKALVIDLRPRCRYVDRKEADAVKARIALALEPPKS